MHVLFMHPFINFQKLNAQFILHTRAFSCLRLGEILSVCTDIPYKFKSGVANILDLVNITQKFVNNLDLPLC